MAQRPSSLTSLPVILHYGATAVSAAITPGISSYPKLKIERVTGDTAWLEKKDWKDFVEYEDSLNQAVANQRLAVLCTYPLAACGERERPVR